MTDEQVKRGLEVFLKTHKDVYPNTNLIAYIRHYGFAETDGYTAGEAWGEVITGIKRGQKPNFKKQITEKIVGLIGWSNLNRSNNPELDRTNFLKMFEQIQKSEKEKQLRGL